LKEKRPTEQKPTSAARKGKGLQKFSTTTEGRGPEGRGGKKEGTWKNLFILIWGGSVNELTLLEGEKRRGGSTERGLGRKGGGGEVVPFPCEENKCQSGGGGGKKIKGPEEGSDFTMGGLIFPPPWKKKGGGSLSLVFLERGEPP